jgi:hypothetical protein
MAKDDVSPAQFRAALEASASVLGRYTGPELFFQQNVALTAAGGAQTVNLPRTLNLNRPVSDIFISLRGRITVTVGPYTAVAPEALQNLIQNIQIQGIHKDFGNLTPINISGATAFLWPALSQRSGIGTSIVNGVYQAFPAARPMASNFTGAVGTHDFIVVLRIPVGPLLGQGQAVKRQYTNFLWMAEDWADSLQTQIRFGDASALGDPTGATVAFTAFQSATGSPVMSIHLGYSLLTQFARMVRSGVVIRTEQPTAQQQTALTTQAVLQTLQKQITANLLVKTGTIQTAGLTAGVDTLATLSDFQLDRTQITVDNKPVRNNQDNIVFKANEEALLNTLVPEGYFLLSFVEGQNALLSYRGDGLAGGSQFQLQSDVIAASANNRQRFIQEMIYGGPFPAQR